MLPDWSKVRFESRQPQHSANQNTIAPHCAPRHLYNSLLRHFRPLPPLSCTQRCAVPDGAPPAPVHRRVRCRLLRTVLG